MAHKVVDVGGTKSHGWVLDQDFLEEILDISGYILWNVKLALFNEIKCVVLVDSLEGQLGGKHLIDDNTKGPQVAGICSLPGLKHLWRYKVL